MSYPYIVQGSNITVVIGSQSHTISKTHIAYQRVLDAIKASDWETVKNVVDPVKVVLDYGQGYIAVKGDQLFWKGQEMHNSLSRRIIEMLQDGFPVEPMVRFMENLMENPSNRAVNELYRFLEKNSLPITPDGYFLAYKRVKDDYYDVHSGTVLNKPANLLTDEDRQVISKPGGKRGEVTVAVENGVTVVSMARNNVDDVYTNTCSDGLHICSQDYLNKFGGSRVMILRVNPRDVVSIPSDYQSSKGRVCRYEIVSELGVDPDDAFVASVQEDAVSS